MENWDKIKSDENVKEYIGFLESNQEVYYIKDFPWVKYQGILMPAVSIPLEPTFFSLRELQQLLKRSRVPLVRWSDKFTDKKTEWWWVTTSSAVDIMKLNRGTRNEIRRGNKRCVVKQLKAEWLAENGYQCYYSAYRRYRNAKPANEEVFRKQLKEKIDKNCFEFWGVFADNKLAGYCECVLLGKTVSTSVIKYHPDYLRKYYSAYALTFAVLDNYLNRKKFNLVSNGERSIAHDTNIQSFLEQFGFKKQYCQLNVIYSPLFGLLVKIVYPLRRLIDIIYKLIPINFLHKIAIILRQEKIRRISYEK